MDEAALIAHHIALDPLRPGADKAHLVGSGIPVWQIIRDLKAAKGNVLAVAATYGLPREVVVAVRTYYHTSLNFLLAPSVVSGGGQWRPRKMERDHGKNPNRSNQRSVHALYQAARIDGKAWL